MRRPGLPIVEPAVAPTIPIDEVEVERIGSTVRVLCLSPDVDRGEGRAVIRGRRLEAVLAVPADCFDDIVKALQEARTVAEIGVDPFLAPPTRRQALAN